MRYVYGMTAALLIGGAVATLTLNPATAQPTPGTISAAAPPGAAPISFADLAARLQPAVVNIAIRQTISVNRQQGLPPGIEDFFHQFGMRPPGGGGGDDVRRGASQGSGFIISPDGYIVTNNHVIAPAGNNATVDSITVTLSDRRELQAKLIGRDKDSDLAVLKIDATNLPYVRFGDSTRTRVGDWVVAVGNPFGLGGSVTAGIVSALHRNLDAGPFDRYIQTDASINMGNSGGPMFDLNGNVIGINTMLISPTGGNVGVGFAIPAEQAKPVIDALRRGTRPQRGYLGIVPQPVDDDNLARALGIAKNSGELVRSVTPGGPADRAGIRQGDVITRIDGKPVTQEERVTYLVSNLPAGARVPFEILRDGQRRTVSVVAGERPGEEEMARLSGSVTPPAPARPPAEAQQSPGQRSARQSLGITVQALTPELARSMNLTDPALKGVVVSSVDPSSDAAEEGIQARDIILSINQRPTHTPEQVAAAVEAARSADRGSVLLLVKRGAAPPIYLGVGIAKS